MLPVSGCRSASAPSPPAIPSKVEVNAATARFLDTNFDLDGMAHTLGVDAMLLTHAFLNNVKNNVEFQPEMVEFSSVSADHLDPLRDIGRLVFRPEAVAALTEAGNAILEPYTLYRAHAREHAWPRSEAGPRVFVDSIVVPAVHAAQELQATSPITVISDTGTSQTEAGDRLVIIPRYDVPPTRVGEGGAAVCFHGLVDFAVVLVHGELLRDLQVWSAPPPPRPRACLIGILEATAPVTLEAGRPQIEAQCLALLRATGRACFAGVLTNGLCWLFYVAVAHEDLKGITIFESANLVSGKDDGLIVGALVEVMRHPDTVPSVFSTTRAQLYC